MYGCISIIILILPIALWHSYYPCSVSTHTGAQGVNCSKPQRKKWRYNPTLKPSIFLYRLPCNHIKLAYLGTNNLFYSVQFTPKLCWIYLMVSRAWYQMDDPACHQRQHQPSSPLSVDNTILKIWLPNHQFLASPARYYKSASINPGSTHRAKII